MPPEKHLSSLRETILNYERAIWRQAGFEWGKIKNQPLFPLLKSETTTYAVEHMPEDLSKGDLTLHYWNHWQLLAATGQQMGTKDIYYTGDDTNTFTSFHSMSQGSYRLAKQMQIDVPLASKAIPVDDNQDKQPYLTTLPTQQELKGFSYSISEEALHIREKQYTLKRINSLKEIVFCRDGSLEHDYLYISTKGTPIIISDFHHKLPLHIGLTIGMELLPNEIPILDWADFHPDTNNGSHNARKEHNTQHTLESLRDIVNLAWCGETANLLYMYSLAEVRAFEEMSVLSPPWFANILNPLNFSNPFSRPHLSKPHVLSFDLDQIPYNVETLYGNTVFEPRGLEKTTAGSYFKWLNNAGMNASSYDAVYVYTSPGYIEPKFAGEAMQLVVGLFE
jgi:hypothetical protein